jgi:tetratricopeptide (TPR) repeat protein
VKASRSALETAAQLSPGRTAPREALAGVYAASNDSDLAIDQLEALAVLDPGRPERFVALGLAYSRARRHEAAVLVLSRAVAKFPADPQVYGALGRVWLDAAQGRGDDVAFKKALEALTTAASHPEVSSESLTDLGRAWLLGGDPTNAERAFRQAIVRLPVTPDAYRELASLAARAGRIAEARDSLIRYATLVGDTTSLATVAAQIADYSIRVGDTGLALRWIERAEDHGGRSPSLDGLRRRASK